MVSHTPIVVSIRMDKLNPTVKPIVYKNITLVKKWQEETVARFVMSANGEILDLHYLPKALVESKVYGGM